MVTELNDAISHETHEQFVQRASRVFQEDGFRAWSRIERAVFNHLLGRLINEHGYDSISNRMLEESRDNMDKFLRELGCGHSDNIVPGF